MPKTGNIAKMGGPLINARHLIRRNRNRIFHNPPGGARGDVVPLAKMEIRSDLPGPTLYSAGWLWLGFGLSAFFGGFVPSYRWFALGVFVVGSASVLVSDVSIGGGFVSIMLVCVMCWFCAFLLAAVSCP